jgi:hypothetical protein
MAASATVRAHDRRHLQSKLFLDSELEGSALIIAAHFGCHTFPCSSSEPACIHLKPLLKLVQHFIGTQPGENLCWITPRSDAEISIVLWLFKSTNRGLAA